MLTVPTPTLPKVSDKGKLRAAYRQIDGDVELPAARKAFHKAWVWVWSQGSCTYPDKEMLELAASFGTRRWAPNTARNARRDLERRGYASIESGKARLRCRCRPEYWPDGSRKWCSHRPQNPPCVVRPIGVMRRILHGVDKALTLWQEVRCRLLAQARECELARRKAARLRALTPAPVAAQSPAGSLVRRGTSKRTYRGEILPRLLEPCPGCRSSILCCCD